MDTLTLYILENSKCISWQTVNIRIFCVSPGGEIGHHSQWNLGDFFPQFKKIPIPPPPPLPIFFFLKHWDFHSVTTHTSCMVTFSFDLMAIVCVIIKQRPKKLSFKRPFGKDRDHLLYGENLSQGLLKKQDSNQSPQLQRLAKKLKFHL